ncbi:MAG TPA: peptidase S1, partial [Brevundimonas sp.]|nr:peptidase S1 [Brevundimonas sp.]
MKIAFALAAASAALISVSASAQDWGQTPNFGSAGLAAGFTPDPYTVQITSGGTVDAGSTIGGECRGMITDAPDFRLNY